MPYRRLPNTNQARLRSLQKVVEMGENFDLPFLFKVLEEAKNFLPRYEQALYTYKQCVEKQATTNVKYQNKIKTARLYVSHFIQVFHMCVARSEIKAENKKLYGLDENSSVVPDLNSEENLLEWGGKTIEGETQRIAKGGTPIYNPAIAKVRVYYDIFVESYNDQKILQNNTARALDTITRLNARADSLIIEIWDLVEDHFSNLPPRERLQKCQKFGIIYYYRRGEKEWE